MAHAAELHIYQNVLISYWAALQFDGLEVAARVGACHA
jgi:hypothetical protein